MVDPMIYTGSGAMRHASGTEPNPHPTSTYIPKVGRVDFTQEMSYLVGLTALGLEERTVRFEFQRCGKDSYHYYELVSIELTSVDPYHHDCEVTWVQFSMMLGPTEAAALMRRAMEMAP